MSENLTNRFHNLPQGYRFIISGGLGTLTNLILYEMIYFVNPYDNFRASISWFIAYFIAIATQHAYHRWLTFTDPISYLKSLGRSYQIYSGSLIISTILDLFLVISIGLQHRIAFLITMISVSILNFFALKMYGFNNNQSD